MTQIEHDPNENPAPKSAIKSEILSFVLTAVPMGLVICFVRGDFAGYSFGDALAVAFYGLFGAASLIFIGYLLCKAWDSTVGKILGRIRNRRNAKKHLLNSTSLRSR